MNLFFLCVDPKKCAEYHCDKHVVKMIIELVQMLYTAHRVHNSELPPGAYRISNKNHPMCVWIRKCEANYLYAAQVAVELGKEYTYRYSKIHSSAFHAEWLLENIPLFEQKVDYIKQPIFSSNTIPGTTPVPLSMPEDSMLKDTIKSYRQYYLLHKVRFAKWTRRNPPEWFCYINVFKI